MAFMSSRVETPVTSLVDGTALAVVTPGMIWQGFVAGGSSLPPVTIAAGSTTLPFATNPAFGAASPFYANVASMSTFGLDSCTIDFVNTQSTINCSGKLEASFFYEPPNATWFRTAAGTYNTAAISITDQEITNNVGYVKRWANTELTELTRIGTVIPDEDNGKTVSSTENTDAGSNYFDNIPFVMLKWTGCQSATQIGTLFVTMAISFEPVAAQRGIFSVQPRGSYQGTFRLFKQLRKAGVALEFLKAEDILPVCVENFA